MHPTYRVGFGYCEEAVRTSVRVEVPSRVIELDGPPSCVLPHTKTEVPHVGRESGGLELVPIPVPHFERFQERCAGGIRIVDVP
jgi:hypothetical protein